MIIEGECLEEMRKMDDNSIDFMVTDPPYGLNFMGKKWDSAVPNVDIWKEALRICKPGSMLAAFGGSRTHHHLMIALEQAGWEIRDTILYWGYGSGFPKSHNFGRKLSEEWHGYGTALKPAYEPIIIAMKPCDGTFAQNAEKWGVAGINIDASRIATTEKWQQQCHDIRNNGLLDKKGRLDRVSQSHDGGRWPANIILNEEAAQQLGEPSRFFYCAKASSRERNEGCEGLELKESGIKNDSGRGFSESDPYAKIMRHNNHPTVKPISLMKYIITLLAPPGNPTLLDPFAGSGSTLIAAQELSITSLGIELNPEYAEIARARLKKFDQKVN